MSVDMNVDESSRVLPDQAEQVGGESSLPRQTDEVQPQIELLLDLPASVVVYYLLRKNVHVFMHI